MRTIEQLRMDFALYIDEIDCCLSAQCYWALLHVLVSLPDVCASLEANGESKVGDRYVDWCSQHLPKSATVSSADRYQMRNALLHAGSTTAQNVGKKHQTRYTHFSYIDPNGFDVSLHNTTTSDGGILNVHPQQMAVETKEALEHWFATLQADPTRMSQIEQNLERMARRQPKRVVVDDAIGNAIETTGWTQSST